MKTWMLAQPVNISLPLKIISCSGSDVLSHRSKHSPRMRGKDSPFLQSMFLKNKKREEDVSVLVVRF